MEQPTECYETTTRDKRWPYIQLYLGKKDQSEQRHGQGENRWSGPESLQSYTGTFLQDTMHGEGDYRWRYKGDDDAFVTYEGQFYANKMHGYGVMSYPDGNVFTGLYYNNVRWGPGIEQTPALKSNVGLWRGTQLARLTWMPDTRPVVLDLTTGPAGPTYLIPYRTILTEEVETIGEHNSAIKMMKNAGCDPMLAEELWPRMYPLTCSDPASVVFNKNLFDLKYYKDNIYSLKEHHEVASVESGSNQRIYVADYFAWNNNQMMVHMMKHAFKHDKQSLKTNVNLTTFLNGPRQRFRPAGTHETNSRTMLFASFLGHIKNVAQLVNEEDVYADIADIRGNTALMYAVVSKGGRPSGIRSWNSLLTCGDNRNVVHFLVEAGANVNCCNDSCCTPLGVALLRYLSVVHDITADKFPLTILPPLEKGTNIVNTTLNEPVTAMDWKISRDLFRDVVAQKPAKKPSVRAMPPEAASSLHTRHTSSVIKSVPGLKGSSLEINYDSAESISTEEGSVFSTMRAQYDKRVSEIYPTNSENTEIKYLFTVNKIDTQSLEIVKPMPRKEIEKSHQILWENHAVDVTSLDSLEKQKHDILTEIELTIMDLLALGADPKLVVCPQPAVLLALKTRKPDIIIQMVTRGVDVNQQFPDLLNYTVLDIVITDEEINAENLAMMETLLKLGADTQHRIPPPEILPTSNLTTVTEIDRPTLLHAVLMKTPEVENEEDLIERIIKVLLSYKCDPSAQYLGSSAIDTVMMDNFNLLNIFVQHPSTNLNAIINSKNQTILVKLFSKEFFREKPQIDLFPMVTNLLLYGADPLIECYNENLTYVNVFHFARETYDQMYQKVAAKLDQMKYGVHKSTSNMKSAKRTSQYTSVMTNQSFKARSPEIEALDYKELLDLMTECARMLHVRWVQGKLIRDLIDIIIKFNHRPWNTIIREVKNGYVLGLWLNAQRCMEIWDTLKTTKKKKYTNPKTYRKLLSIVHFYSKRVGAKVDVKKPLTGARSNILNAEVKCLLEDNKFASLLYQEGEPWKMVYVQPELEVNGEHKFNVCFECSLQLPELYLTCEYCKLVSFCNIDCLKENIGNFTNHPCDTFLIEKYVNSSDSSYILQNPSTDLTIKLKNSLPNASFIQ